MKLHRSVAAMAASLLAVGCSGSDAPDADTTPLPGQPETNSEQSHNELPTSEPLVDAHPVPLSGWEQVGQDVLRLHFSGGTSECFGAAVDKEEDQNGIRVAVSVGSLESMESADCAAISLASHVDVEFSSPIDDRHIFDMHASS